MSTNQNVQDILIGTILGMILGIVLSLWASVFDHLFLQDKSREYLSYLFIFYSLVLIFIEILLWITLRRFRR